MTLQDAFLPNRVAVVSTNMHYCSQACQFKGLQNKE